MKKYIVTLMIVAVCLCGIMAVLLLNNLERAKDGLERDLRIEKDGVTSDTLEVEHLSLVPGSEMEYTVKLMCQIEGNYDLSLAFTPTKESPLKDFVQVEVVLDGTVLETATLTKVLSGTAMESRCYLAADAYSDLVIRFKMPAEVGDEAKNLTADFNIDLEIAIDTKEE